MGHGEAIFLDNGAEVRDLTAVALQIGQNMEIFVCRTANGAQIGLGVSVHHGGGVGMGLSIHAGMVIVADGSAEAAARLKRVLTYDPGMGIMRHADAGYKQAVTNAQHWNIKIPMMKRSRTS